MRTLSFALTLALVAASLLAVAPAASAGNIVTFCPAYNPDARANACIHVDDNATVVPYPTGVQSHTIKECVIGDVCASAPGYTPTWGTLSEPGVSSYGYVEITACKGVLSQCRREFTTDVRSAIEFSCDTSSPACTLPSELLP